MKNYILYFFLFSNIIWSQENTGTIPQETSPQEGFKIITEFDLQAFTNFYFGKNYLAKGHSNPGIGGSLTVNFYQFDNYKLGATFAKSTIKVSDIAIGGNINNTNINSLGAVLSYNHNITEIISITPHIKFSSVKLNQYSDIQYYGQQKGSLLSLGTDVNYKVDNFVIYFNIGYSRYFLNVNTSPEFQSYFDNSNAINLAFGVKL
jgi:hypothetical protein